MHAKWNVTTFKGEEIWNGSRILDSENTHITNVLCSPWEYTVFAPHSAVFCVIMTYKSVHPLNVTQLFSFINYVYSPSKINQNFRKMQKETGSIRESQRVHDLRTIRSPKERWSVSNYPPIKKRVIKNKKLSVELNECERKIC